MHSYDGTLEDALALINEFGLYIGINGCSLRTPENLNVVKLLPLEKLMVETGRFNINKTRMYYRNCIKAFSHANPNEDAPWCDIRPKHQSHPLIKDLQCVKRLTFKKKEKFEMGLLVKGRNEPCTVELSFISSFRLLCQWVA